MKTKQSKIWLSAALSLAMVGTAVGGFVALDTLEAKADGAVTLGKFISYDGYQFNGTSTNADENRTVMKCVVSGWNRTLLYAENVTSQSQVEMELTSDKGVTLQLTVFDNAASVQYGTPVNEALTANTMFSKSFKLGEVASFGDATSCVFGFYIDTASATPSGAKITINKFTVDGVSYTKEDYDPSKDEVVAAPEKAFKEFEQWTGATNCTVAAGTLEAMPNTDDRYATAIDNGRATITIPANSSTTTADDGQVISASVEIPFYEALTNGWPTDWTNLYVKLKAENITNVNIYFEEINNCDECTEAEWKGWHGINFALWSGGAPSVSEGFKVATEAMGSRLKSYTDYHTAMPTKLVLAFIVRDTTQEAKVEIGGMTFAKTAPVFINDVGAPELTLGEWNDQSNGNYTITPNSSLTVEEETYEGLKVEYAQTAQYDNMFAAVANFDATKTPNLHIGFYTDSDVVIAIYNNWTAIQGHTAYTAGYHNVELDVSAIANFENLRFYFDSANALEEGDKKTVVIDSIVFYEDLEIVFDDAIPGAIYKDVETTETGISWKYDAAAAGEYHNVAIPVNHWYSFVGRYVIIDVTFSHDLKFGVGFTNSQWGNADLLAHVAYKKGDYKFCFDVSNAADDNALNKLWFYCDVANKSEIALEKTVNIKSITFSNVPALSSPNATVVTIDYAEQTISFDATKYQVSTTEEFTEGTLLESGAAITPGTKIYLREFRGEELSPVTEIELAATPLTAATAPAPDVTANSIRYSATGYEFKMEGKDNEWKTLGSWGGLTADTEYTIQIRKAATDSAFASDPVTVKITTTGNAGTPGGDEKPASGGCKSSIAGGLGIGLATCALTAGAAVCFVKKRKN